MRRFFNTAGPVAAAKHYCIPPLERLDLRDVLDLIRTERYFVLHAPRQTGKTSALLALRDLLNGGGEGDYRCVYVNVEPAQAMREDVEAAMRAILGALASWARATLNDGFLDEVWPGILAKHGPAGALGEALTRWSEADAKPLVLLVDEIDALVGDTLLSVLRQLRAGYVRRPTGFPQSVVLCGVRDVRDYRIHSGTEKAVIAGGSAFNVKARSLRLGDFSRDDVTALLAQHTRETGQVFEREALDTIWERTQPWLVNALADETCFRAESGRDHSRAIVWPEPTAGSGAAGTAGRRTRKFVIECKVLHKSLERTIQEGLEQTAAYMDRCAAEAGHLVIFDRSDRAWDDNVFHRRESADGTDIHVWGM